MPDQQTTLDDLFAVKLQGLYDAEQQLVQALPKLVAKATDPRLGFEKHLADPATATYVTIAGTAAGVEGRAKIKNLWRKDFRGWFSKGSDASSSALLRIDIENGEYWNEPGNVFVRAYAKAVATGEKHHPTPEEQAKVRA